MSYLIVLAYVRHMLISRNYDISLLTSVDSPTGVDTQLSLRPVVTREEARNCFTIEELLDNTSPKLVEDQRAH
jgi:hypothetical protein